MAILFIIFLLFIGGVAGYFIGSRNIRLENNTIKKQNERLERFSDQWFNAARHTTELTNTLSAQQNTNLSNTVNTVVHLLSQFQIQNSNNLNQQQNEKVSQLINQARNLSGFRE